MTKPAKNKNLRVYSAIAALIFAVIIGSPVIAQDAQPSGVWQGHVKGIGGVFFKVENPEAVNKWYQEHLGLDNGTPGFAYFLWRSYEGPTGVNRTVWSTFPKTSDYFGNPQQQVMINYIVDDLEAFLKELNNSGVKQIGEIVTYEYGSFAWIEDIEGNRIELWQPVETIENIE